MKHWIQYRYMQPGEELAICGLIIRVFSEFIAHQYSDQGILGFLKYIQPRFLSRRLQEDSFVLVAVTQEKIVGMIELVGNRHISLLFVDEHLQRIGIGKELLKKGLKICREKNPALKEITVNSSPNAVNIYKKIAFSVIDSEEEKNNIRFVAMNAEISNCLDTLSAQI